METPELLVSELGLTAFGMGALASAVWICESCIDRMQDISASIRERDRDVMEFSKLYMYNALHPKV